MQSQIRTASERVTTPVKDRNVSEERYKPVADEQTLAKLLEAAYVLQEHNREMQRLGSRPGVKRNRPDTETPDLPPKRPPLEARVSQPAASSNNSSTLAKIVETQHQIQVRRLDFETALNLVAERVSELTNATGAAIGTVEGKNVRYRAVAGRSTPLLDSSVTLDKAIFGPCVTSGEVFRSADTSIEILLDADDCKRRNIQSVIAVPVYHDGEIAGGLELYYATPKAFSDQDVHTCQLMAGLIGEALVRQGEATSKKSLASERAAMLEALEKLQPNLAALVETPSAKEASAPEPVAPRPPAYLCRKCGHQLVADEQFCGQCGSPRAGDYEPPNTQSKVASLWQMQESQKKAFGPESPRKVSQGTPEKFDRVRAESPLSRSLDQQIPDLFASDDLETENAETVDIQVPLKVHEIASTPNENFIEETAPIDEPSDGPPDNPAALAKPELTQVTHWRSAASARAFLEQLAANKRTGTLLRFWNTHRGDIYLAIAVILVACVIRWGLWSDHSVKATASPAKAAATQRKPAADAGLSFFDRMLIQLGLAEAPDPPPDNGNPAVQVWVDLRTALYYCPGADLYGKTTEGKYTTQRAAQLDQFQPAYRKTCN